MNTHRILVAGVALLLTPLAALAQTWDGGGANDNFTTVANWNPNGAPVNSGTADLIFDGNTRLTPKVNVNYDVDSITFHPFAGIFNIGQLNNATLTVRGGGITNNAVNSQIINVPVNFATGSAITANSGDLHFILKVGLGTSAVTVSGGANTILSEITGTGSLVKNGTGTLGIVPFAAQDYDLAVNAGAVSYTSDATFNASSAITVNGGELRAHRDLTLSGSQFTRSSTATFTLDPDQTMTVQSGGSATFQGAYEAEDSVLYRVTGAGSTFTADDFLVNNEARFEVLAGADATFMDFDVAPFGGSALVDGAGSTLLINGPNPSSFLFIGTTSGSAASLTFRNAAVGNLGNDGVNLAARPNATASFAVESGSQVTARTLQVAINGVSGDTASVTVRGGASKFITTSGTATVEIGASTGSAGTVNVENGGELDLAGPLVIHATGTLNINGGTVSLKLDKALVNVGTLNFNSGRISLGDTLNIGGGASPLGVNVSLAAGREISVPSSRTTAVTSPGAVVIDGGLLSTGSLVNNGGTIDFRRGRLLITGAAGLAIGPGGPLGPSVTLASGQSLAVTSTVTVEAGAALAVESGGSMSAGTLANSGNIILGAANSTLRGGVVNNAGVVRGDGRITAVINNATAGEIRGEHDKTLTFTSASGPNNGRITLQGGTLQFTQELTNAVTGAITGRGTLFFDGGLTNQGKMQFSGGPTDIYGNVSFTGGAGGGELINSGGANVVTFYGNVTHNGDEIRTSPTNATVFFGNVTGAGSFTGTGAVRFEGTFMPGNSPAAVSVDGDMQLGANSRPVMEIAGTTGGAEYDQLHIGGLLSLDGSLAVSLLDGFAPRYGDTFDLFNFGALAGRFDTLSLPALDGGLGWDTTSLYTTGTISAIPEPRSNVLFASAILCLCIFAWRAAIRKQPKLGRKSQTSAG